MHSDALTKALRALHAAGVIHSWVRPGMRLVNDEACRSYMVVALGPDGGLWLSQDDTLDDPGEVDTWAPEHFARMRVADDAVTNAALLPIAREALGDPALYVAPIGSMYAAAGKRSVFGVICATEREALTSALLVRLAEMEAREVIESDTCRAEVPRA